MKKLYFGYLLLYLIIFLIELISYLNFPSSTFGFVYLLIEVVILFLFGFIVFNYKEKNKNIRVSKNLILIFIMLFSLLILPRLMYIDQSKEFINKYKILLYYVKSFLILTLLIISYLDFKPKKIS